MAPDDPPILHANRLLAALPAADAEALGPHLERVPLDRGFYMERPGHAISHVYLAPVHCWDMDSR